MSGVVVVDSKSAMSFSSIKLTVEGSVTLQLSARSIGLFEAFYSSLKPMQLVYYEIEVHMITQTYAHVHTHTVE